MYPEPVATYRLQLHPGFGFDRVEALIPYLKKLGVSHVYTSPYLQTVTGSTSGYDVVDPTKVNSELGGEEAHSRFCRALEQAGMGQMIDLVPNHMAINSRQNSWWWDVLENSLASRYAGYFDIDWNASPERWQNKVLMPVLGDHYGRVLEAGEIRLERNENVFTLHYKEHAFPVAPSSLAPLLERAATACGSEQLKSLAGAYARLPSQEITIPESVKKRDESKREMEKRLLHLIRELPGVQASIDAGVAGLNNNQDALDKFIEMQNYRLAYWRVASREIGYRRFFDINNLVGLRVEEEEVFRATHALPVSWVTGGLVHGLRIDHPDGLYDPAQYFRRLREACPGSWLVAEKIISPSEKIPEDWNIDGTTGYDFLNIAGGLFIDPRGEEPLTRFYQDFTGETDDFSSVVYKCKRQVLTEILAGDLNNLTTLFMKICERHRRYRDYTRYELNEALCEVAACFPVYRTYIRATQGTVSETDRQYIAEAVDRAILKRPELDSVLFHFLRDILLLRLSGPLEGELVMRFQQLTGPVMAKGLEDTAFYRYHRLISLNEVGVNPYCFGTTVADFHGFCLEAQQKCPRSLLATATHDTKRSEDVRARLALLSEIPEQWSQAVRRWAHRNDRYRVNGIPDRNTEYLFYQTLAGAWPINAQRMVAYMEKAVCEAKVQTSWMRRNETYEQGVLEFVQRAMNDGEFCRNVQEFVDSLVIPGRINSLAQTLLKLTAPGVPDIYQGTEIPDFSLVDPDNRQPVDFTYRESLLSGLENIAPREILAHSDRGLPKLWVIYKALHMRREHPAWFGTDGSYRPLSARGTKAEHVVAFVRGERAVTVVPRLPLRLGNDWGDTNLELEHNHWRNVLTDERIEGKVFALSRLLERFPVALLMSEE